VVEGKKVTPEEVKALADLPSKEVLIATMLAVFNGPTTNFAGIFNSLLRKLVGTLDAIREKKGSE
jgi:large subunit ribosomal protein L10